MKIIKIKENKKRRLTIRGILSILVAAVAVRSFLAGNYENLFTCILTLLLFCVPLYIDRRLRIDLPPTLEAIIYLFIFAAEIQGEIGSFYTKYPGWDTMLHTTNGFLMAAIGFALVDIFNRSERFSMKLSPFFLAIVAFCFSMTVGVLWEFFEFGMDWFFHMDMQKDFFVNTINTVALNPDGLNIVEHIPIESLIVNGEDWLSMYGGYLDIGLIDTMKDLFVNFIGAVVFSVIGFLYTKHRESGSFAEKFIPKIRE